MQTSISLFYLVSRVLEDVVVRRFIISYHHTAMVSGIEVLVLGFGIPEMPMTSSHTNEPRNSAATWFIYQRELA
jgi:hypothetical protein